MGFDTCTEFSGTLLGFDDYVSKYPFISPVMLELKSAN